MSGGVWLTANYYINDRYYRQRQWYNESTLTTVSTGWTLKNRSFDGYLQNQLTPMTSSKPLLPKYPLTLLLMTPTLVVSCTYIYLRTQGLESQHTFCSEIHTPLVLPHVTL